MSDKPWSKIKWQAENARLANKPFNDLFSEKAPIDLKTFDLQAQFKRCEEWNDPEQWDALAMLYYQRGYLLNACHCFKRADACRQPRADFKQFIGVDPAHGDDQTVYVAVETEAGDNAN